jgi:hypothetical protein
VWVRPGTMSVAVLCATVSESTTSHAYVVIGATVAANVSPCTESGERTGEDCGVGMFLGLPCVLPDVANGIPLLRLPLMPGRGTAGFRCCAVVAG